MLVSDEFIEWFGANFSLEIKIIPFLLSQFNRQTSGMMIKKLIARLRACDIALKILE